MNNLTDRDNELFNDSFERCMQNTRAPGFLDRFYEIFIASSLEVAQKFLKTDFPQQVRALKASLCFLMMASGGDPESVAHLEEMAQLHDRKHLNIRPELYDLWLTCLLEAVREYDELFDPETEMAWRRVLGFGIEFMKARY